MQHATKMTRKDMSVEEEDGMPHYSYLSLGITS